MRLRSVLDKLSHNSVVIDCGANIGDISLLFARTKAKVFAFEPDPLAFNILKQRTKSFCNVFCYQKGVGTANETAKMYLHKGRAKQNDDAFSVSSSIFGEKKNIDPNNFIEIETVDLSEFINSFEEKVAVVKMDIEGAEIDIITSLIANETYKKVEIFFVETHENKIPGHSKKVRQLQHLLATKNIQNIKLNWI